MSQRFVYDFSEGSRAMSALLGGKGANLAEMVSLLGRESVPDGFTVTTEACMGFLRAESPPAGLIDEIDGAVARLERSAGRGFGSVSDPLLLSVRSGGRVSMPGMMDTVLNLGLGDRQVDGLAAATGDERFAWDSYRRLVQMFAGVVRGVPNGRLEDEVALVKRANGTTLDSELDTTALIELTERFKALIDTQGGSPFPEEPRVQLIETIEAVFKSWNGPRAIQYRRINRIPDEWGTAANVQAMVFGNMGEGSGSGVAFSRDEVTGEPTPSGDWLPTAQGEDVVSGSRDPLPLSTMGTTMPSVHSELIAVLERLERHFGDMQDVEFTVERGRLWILQTRRAKRPAQASVRFACDSVDEGLLDRDQALMTIDASALDSLLLPHLARQIEEHEIAARGVAASPGAASGPIAFTVEAASRASAAGRPAILVRRRTEAEDVAGFHSAAGILTATGGKASHAALVARGMGRPCVCGASSLAVDPDAGELRLADGTVLIEGDTITIDGSTGLVSLADLELVEAKPDSNLERVLGWADSIRRLGVRANADTPDEANRARSLGAEGIGLCRTEHMFMASDRQELMRQMILAADTDSRASALDRLLPLQQADFEAILTAMEGLPVAIRLLDPPLHEFLRDRHELEGLLLSARERGDLALAADLERELERSIELHEANPMLGTRGVRLGLVHPEIYAMQVRALCRATISVANETGSAPRVEVMIPLVAFEPELALAREAVLSVAAREGLGHESLPPVGTMIELPRACLTADRIARHGDFFSFGTNDLTQTTLGFSRDDVEPTIMDRYLDLGVVDRSPFATVDADGVGQLITLAVGKLRAVDPDAPIGVCGEHGGDPDSISFFELAGIDYVSCSPPRLPVARVAAAQARIGSTSQRSTNTAPSLPSQAG